MRSSPDALLQIEADANPLFIGALFLACVLSLGPHSNLNYHDSRHIIPMTSNSPAPSVHALRYVKTRWPHGFGSYCYSTDAENTAALERDWEAAARQVDQEAVKPAVIETEAKYAAVIETLRGACKSGLRALDDHLEPGPLDGDAKQGLRDALNSTGSPTITDLRPLLREIWDFWAGGDVPPHLEGKIRAALRLQLK